MHQRRLRLIRRELSRRALAGESLHEAVIARALGQPVRVVRLALIEWRRRLAQ